MSGLAWPRQPPTRTCMDGMVSKDPRRESTRWMESDLWAGGQQRCNTEAMDGKRRVSGLLCVRVGLAVA